MHLVVLDALIPSDRRRQTHGKVCHLLRVERDFCHSPHIHKTTGYPLRATASRASFSGDRGFFPDLNRDSIPGSMPVSRPSSAWLSVDAFSFRRTSASVGAATADFGLGAGVVLAGGVGAGAAAAAGTVAGGVAAGAGAVAGAPLAMPEWAVRISPRTYRAAETTTPRGSSSTRAASTSSSSAALSSLVRRIVSVSVPRTLSMLMLRS